MAAGTPRANDLAGGTRLPCRRLRNTAEPRVFTMPSGPIRRHRSNHGERPDPTRGSHGTILTSGAKSQRLREVQRHPHRRRNAHRLHPLRRGHRRPDVGWPQRRRAMCGPISIGCLPARLRRKVCHPHRSGATKPMTMTMTARCHQRPPIQLIPHRLRLDDWCRVGRGKPERNHRRSRRRAPLHTPEILDGC